MKARPLSGATLCEQPVRASLLMPHPVASRRTDSVWLTAVQRQMLRPVLQDRHYLLELEENMCIASLDQGTAEYHSIDSFRLLLATRHAQPQLAHQVRELPVSLLRLYFAGQQHFTTLLDGIPHRSFDTLVQLARQDNEPFGDESHWGLAPPSEYETERLVAQKQALARYLTRILDACFCSFERTLCLMANATEAWPDFGLAQALDTDPYWAGLVQPAPFEWYGNRRDTHLAWYACLWRCHVTLQLDRLVKPWRHPEHRDWLLYRMQLFRDTHLDLLSAMIAHQCYADVQLHQRRLLQLHWPACDRVCCAEELPDLASFALDNLKTGTHLKARTTLRDKLGHILFIKTMNNICKDRNFFDIVVRDGEQDELVYDLLKAITRCVLLGNLPRARGQLCMMARVRCNLSFWAPQADRVMTEQEVQEHMPPHRNPYAMELAKREKKRRKEVARGTKTERIEQLLEALRRKQERAGYDKTWWKMLMLKCPYTSSSLVKEFTFWVLESGRCVDELQSLDRRWCEYKEITRIANGQVRQELSRQMGVAGVSAEALDWSVIEHVEKPPDRDYDIKRGKIMEFHALALRVAKKVMKRDFMGIIEVKATGTEEEPSFQRQALAPVYRQDDQLEDQRPTLDELHFVCWYMAQRLREGSGVLETRWFQVLGMTRAGLLQLRDWLFRYYTYDIADDSLKDEIRAFRKRSMNDYLLMKTVFKLVGYYLRDSRLFYLPVAFAVAQSRALRRQLRLEDWEKSPPLLGILYQCRGCMRFANAVVPPLDFTMQSNYSELVRRKAQIYSEVCPRAQHPQINGSTCHNLVLTLADKRTRVVEHYKTQVARAGAPKSGERKAGRIEDEQKRNDELEEEEQRRRRENISFLTVAFCDVQDGLPYCVRSRRQRVVVGRSEVTGANNVVLRSLRRGTRIESTRFTTRTEALPPSGPSTTGNNTNARARDGDEETPEEPDEAGDEQEEFRPQYESNRLLFNPSIDELRKEGREYLQRWFASGQGACTSTITPVSGGVGKPPEKKGGRAADNNKKGVLRLTCEPLTRLYNCQCPLQPVDMPGVVKSGKTLCVECGVMTELTNFSMTSHGPVCTRHCNVGFTLNHPVWQMDTQSASYMQRRRAGLDVTQQLGVETAKQNTRRRPHPSDLASAAQQAFERCEACHTGQPALRVACYDEDLRLRKALCCLSCHRQLRTLLAKHGNVLQLKQLLSVK